MPDFGVRARAKGRNDSVDTSLKEILIHRLSVNPVSCLHTANYTTGLELLIRPNRHAPLLRTFAPLRPWPT